jgi:hypothetical protein
LKFLPKKLSPSPQKYGFGIRDPRSGKKTIPDPGSATLQGTLKFFTSGSGFSHFSEYRYKKSATLPERPSRLWWTFIPVLKQSKNVEETKYDKCKFQKCIFLTIQIKKIFNLNLTRIMNTGSVCASGLSERLVCLYERLVCLSERLVCLSVRTACLSVCQNGLSVCLNWKTNFTVGASGIFITKEY